MAPPVIRAYDASGRTLDDPTDTEVRELFAGLTPDCPFAVVLRLDREPAGRYFFQIRLDLVHDLDPDTEEEDVDVGCTVEFCDGGENRHFCSWITVQPGTARNDELARVFRAWRTGDPGLPRLLPWRPLGS